MKVDKGRKSPALVAIALVCIVACAVFVATLAGQLLNCLCASTLQFIVFLRSSTWSVVFLSKLRYQLTSSLSSSLVSCPILVLLGNFAKREMCIL